MQLNRSGGKRRGRRSQLTAATLGLLSSAAPAYATSPDASGWTVDAALLYYAEDHGRIKTTEPLYDAQYDFSDGRQFSAKVVLDSVSGATPNGAAPANTTQTFQAQTVSGPSGSTSGGPYTVPANTLPLARGFKDERLALDLGYEMPLFTNDKISLGLNGSSEHDFRALGAHLLDSVDLNQKDTQLTGGVNVEQDSVRPVTGFIPAPRSAYVSLTEPGPASANRQQVDLLLGVTQVVSEESLLQLTYSRSTASGDLTDPYRIISVVDSSGNPTGYQYESRPDTRKMSSGFAQYRWKTARREILNASYRYTLDDWGIHSQTADVTYRWILSDRSYVEPHLRAYRQSAANFYRVALSSAEGAAPGYASSDERLGRFDAGTLGIKFGTPLRNGAQCSIRLERYQQFDKVTGVPASAAASMSSLDLAQNLSATWVTVGITY